MIAKNVSVSKWLDISKEHNEQKNPRECQDWQTDPQAACEDSSSWCWVLVRREASPPELAAPGSHYSSRPARGDKVWEMGLLWQHNTYKLICTDTCTLLTSSINSLALPISSGMDTSLLLLTSRTLRGRLNKYFGKTDRRFRLWRKTEHWPTFKRVYRSM